MGLTIERLEQWRNESPKNRSYTVKAEPERHRDGWRDKLPIRAWLWDYSLIYGVAIYDDSELDGLDIKKLKIDEDIKQLQSLQAKLKGVA